MPSSLKWCPDRTRSELYFDRQWHLPAFTPARTMCRFLSHLAINARAMEATNSAMTRDNSSASLHWSGSTPNSNSIHSRVMRVSIASRQLSQPRQTSIQNRIRAFPIYQPRSLRVISTPLKSPLLPIYLTSVLGAPVAVVGAVEGVAEGAASLTKLAAGPLSDRYRAAATDRDRIRHGRARQGDRRGSNGVAGRDGRTRRRPAREGHSRGATGRASCRRHRRRRPRPGVRIPPRDGHFRRRGRSAARAGRL